MKKLILCTFVLLMTQGILKAQQDNNIGLMFGYGSEIEQPGIGVIGEFAIVENLTISPNFLFFSPEKLSYVNINICEAQASLFYLICKHDNMRLYAL